MIGMPEHLALNLGPKVPVNTLTPGLVQTDSVRDLRESPNAEEAAS